MLKMYQYNWLVEMCLRTPVKHVFNAKCAREYIVVRNAVV